MKRWHEDAARTKREWRKYEQRCNNWGNPYCYSGEIGRFRKRKAVACTKTRCGICKHHKYPRREKTVEEVRSETFFKEALKELDNE